VAVAVVQIGIVRMLVPHRLVSMTMRMGFGNGLPLVAVLMVLVVNVSVFVIYSLVPVLMVVAFGQVEP
jgi:hypothetical protein